MARPQSLDSFAAELLKAAVEAPVVAAVAVKKAAQNIKSEARENVRRSAPVHNAGAYNAITYDEPKPVGMRVTSEVGYDRNLPGGAIGNLLEFGGGGDHSPPHRDIGRAADNEETRFEDVFAKLAGKLL